MPEASARTDAARGPVLRAGRVAALLLVLATTARPQGSAADYERAARHAERFRGLAAGVRVEPLWVAPDRLVVRRAEAGGTWRFVHVDAARGELRDAFDHAAVAQALSAATGAEHRADRLGLRVLGVDGERVEILLEGTHEGFVVERDGDGLEPLELADVPGALLEAGNGWRSGEGRGETRVTFTNDASVPVEVLWLDGSGSEHAYADLAPGERHDQHTYAGHVWLVRAEDGRACGPFTARRQHGVVQVTDAALAAGPAEPAGAQPAPRPATDSPDGTWRVRTAGPRVELEDRGSGERVEVALGEVPEGEVTRRVLWSPDSRTIALLRSVDAEERTVHLIESSPRDRKQPRLHTMSYAKPGDVVDALRVVLIDAEQLVEVPVRDDGALADAWSIDELRFAPDGRSLWLRYNRRGHQVLGYYAIDTRSGRLRTIVEERADTFVDYSQKCWMRVLPERGELLWTSERSGHHHLYAVDLATGALRALTSGPWVLRGLDALEEGGSLRIRGMGVHPEQDPYHVHHGRVDLDTGEVTWLTASDGTHDIEWGPDGRFFVTTWSRVDHPPVHELRDGRDGSLVVELGRARTEALVAAGWREPERFVAKGRDGSTDIWGVLHTPTGFDPARRYPVIESIYAGPQGHFVPKAWRVNRDVSELVELGFVVVQIDGMGTNWRSKAFHDVCWRNLGDSGLPDRILWIRAAAATRPWMDLDRVGIYGGSAGGQSSTRALLAHGDFYDAAVSDCGCHDNRMDKIWWNEAWMGWPVGEHYAASSNVDLAQQLEGELLLIVGELDRNVDPASTMQVVDALIRADKDFDLLVIPGAGHGAAESPYGRRRRQDFFVEHLMGVEPRWE